jgi:hypothetical protein
MVTICSTKNSAGDDASTFPPYSSQNSGVGHPFVAFQYT